LSLTHKAMTPLSTQNLKTMGFVLYNALLSRSFLINVRLKLSVWILKNNLTFIRSS